MPQIGNDEYAPSCASACASQTLAPVGDTDCPTELSLEVAEITELFLDTRSSTAGAPSNPVTPYVVDTDNSAAFTTWRTSAVNNTAVGKVRVYYGQGEKPDTEDTVVTLHRNKKATIGTSHPMTFTVNIVDDVTYKALRTLQRCKGTYHAWYCTDTHVYGGDKGVLINIEKVSFLKTGGRGQHSTAVIKFSFVASTDPVRDAKPWDI